VGETFAFRRAQITGRFRVWDVTESLWSGDDGRSSNWRGKKGSVKKMNDLQALTVFANEYSREELGSVLLWRMGRLKRAENASRGGSSAANSVR
jgi:hypothetical protein